MPAAWDSRPRNIPEGSRHQLEGSASHFLEAKCAQFPRFLEAAGVYLPPPITPHDVYGPPAALSLHSSLLNLESLLDGHAPVQIVADDPLAAPFALDAGRTNPKPHSALDAVRSGEADRVWVVLLSEYLRSHRRPDLEPVGVFAAY